MLKLIDLLKNKRKIYHLLREWGFNLTKTTPKVHPDTEKNLENTRFCLLVETDPDLIKANINFAKNENLRMSYLKDELAIALGCELLVHSHRHSKLYTKEIIADNAIALTKNNKYIIKNFDKYQLIKSLEDRNSLYKSLSDEDYIEAVTEFKKQISLVKHKIYYVHSTESIFRELIPNINASRLMLAKIKKALDSDPEVSAALKINPYLLTMAKDIYFDNNQHQGVKHLISTNFISVN